MGEHWAVIGAGMAGLAAARRLNAAGLAVTVFEKSRGLGGRMATRRAGGFRFDHGAQYFTARGERFLSLVETLSAEGLVGRWGEDHVGMPGMSAPARVLAPQATVVGECTVSSLTGGAHGWSVSTADGPAATEGNGTFAGVIVAVPAPQAAPLLASAGCSWDGAARATYAPCWALMLGFPARTTLSQDRLRPGDAAIAWIARDSSKPGRDASGDAIVVHATPAWSREHLEETPEQAAAALLARFRELTGETAEPGFAAAHRWRYALVEQPAGAPFFWDPAARLGACGDWCIGPRVEAAFDSGDSLAGAILGSNPAR
ncbi:renalase [Bosea sp. OAE506]|uniref:NAD(P)/FAD-dependent oxidoreductase n=1 Tax=Bosea sp. OAE506 TaxID=2663870 RepID=UPI00178BA999